MTNQCGSSPKGRRHGLTSEQQNSAGAVVCVGWHGLQPAARTIEARGVLARGTSDPVHVL